MSQRNRLGRQPVETMKHLSVIVLQLSSVHIYILSNPPQSLVNFSRFIYAYSYIRILNNRAVQIEIGQDKSIHCRSVFCFFYGILQNTIAVTNARCE